MQKFKETLAVPIITDLPVVYYFIYFNKFTDKEPSQNVSECVLLFYPIAGSILLLLCCCCYYHYYYYYYCY